MKPRILFINSVCGFGSTGKIVAELSKIEGYDTLVCYGRKKDYANVNSYRFANLFDNAIGAIRTILFDNNLNICTKATKRLINKIKEFNPDIIHIHNLHGYYVNVEMLFNFLKEYNKPIVWTVHDCWPISGYCTAAEYKKCDKYQSMCNECPMGLIYPFSLFKQNVKKDFIKKKRLFNIDNINIVTPSNWMGRIYSKSFMNGHNIRTIFNGINISKFEDKCSKKEKFSVLAVANYWTNDKGVNDLQKIVNLLDKDIELTVVGAGSNRVTDCKTIKHTNNIDELIKLYSESHLLINPTLDDNLPTVNIESLACGTPVVTYNTGGSPEIIDEKTGIVINKGDYKAMADTINALKNNYYFDKKDCLNRSKIFSNEIMKKNYKELYESLLVM